MFLPGWYVSQFFPEQTFSLRMCQLSPREFQIKSEMGFGAVKTCQGDIDVSRGKKHPRVWVLYVPAIHCSRVFAAVLAFPNERQGATSLNKKEQEIDDTNYAE